MRERSVTTTRLSQSHPHCLWMTCTTLNICRLPLLPFFAAFPSDLFRRLSRLKASEIHARSCNAEQTTILQTRLHTLPRHERSTSIPRQLRCSTTSSESGIEKSKQNGFSVETRICTCAYSFTSTKQRRDLQTGNLALHGLCDTRYTHRNGGIGCYSSFGSTACERFSIII